jgi:hypothetical protein
MTAFNPDWEGVHQYSGHLPNTNPMVVKYWWSVIRIYGYDYLDWLAAKVKTARSPKTCFLFSA